MVWGMFCLVVYLYADQCCSWLSGCGAVGVCLNVLWERVPEKGRAIEKGFPVTGSACLWEKELEWFAATAT